LVAEKPQRKQIASRREREIGISFRFTLLCPAPDRQIACGRAVCHRGCFTKELGAAGAILRSGALPLGRMAITYGTRAAKYNAASEEQRQ
jgi:hypothetical protein